mmetsp:Transcript_36417/g.96837  ORF Transcript_36417/g.96837 Transcript_36417/m.96837 type:complete len:253 (-) Transcript_36417:1547-2305(-)
MHRVGRHIVIDLLQQCSRVSLTILLEAKRCAILQSLHVPREPSCACSGKSVAVNRVGSITLIVLDVSDSDVQRGTETLWISESFVETPPKRWAGVDLLCEECLKLRELVQVPLVSVHEGMLGPWETSLEDLEVVEAEAFHRFAQVLRHTLRFLEALFESNRFFDKVARSVADSVSDRLPGFQSEDCRCIFEGHVVPLEIFGRYRSAKERFYIEWFQSENLRSIVKGGLPLVQLMCASRSVVQQLRAQMNLGV